MRILVQAVGTRGDIEPMIAIAEVLSRFGHEVICSFPEVFRGYAENASLAFISLGNKYMDVLETKTAQEAIGGRVTGFRKLFAQLKFVKLHLDIEEDTIMNQYEAVKKADPDLLIHNGIAFYPFLWMVDHPGQTVLISAVPYSVQYVRDHPYILYKKNYGAFLNKMTYKLAEEGVVNSTRRAMKHIGHPRKVSKKLIKKGIAQLKTVYAVSNSLFEKPEYWDDWVTVAGFFERKQPIEFKDSDAIESFLSCHDKVLFISMGSMVNPDPVRLTGIFIEILRDHQIPAIFAINAGALVCPEDYDQKLFYFAKTLPYHWIFPRVYGVIHHGGSGTVHTSLKYGCASMAIPHFIDQFLWNKIIHQKGAGPKGIKISSVTRKNLEPLILDLYRNPVYKRNAELIADQMKHESNEHHLHEFITGQRTVRESG